MTIENTKEKHQDPIEIIMDAEIDSNYEYNEDEICWKIDMVCLSKIIASLVITLLIVIAIVIIIMPLVFIIPLIKML